jgi:teichuronic acid biosynthesis glycosyltransferase TuaC
VLRIAVVTRYFPNSAQPIHGRSAYQTLRVLAREADVRVFYPNSTYPSLLKPRSRTYNRLDPLYSLPDVNVSYYDYPALPLISRPLNGWRAARVLLPDVRRFAPDLVFSFVLYPYGYAALKIGQALSVPVVAMGIGSDVHSIGDRISAMHTRTVLRGVDFLATVSDDLRMKAVSMGAPPERTRTVLNGCDLSVFHVGDRLEARQQLHIDPTSKAVIYIGRMDIKKGLRELVDAATALRPHRPNLQVYLVGEGPDTRLIESAVQASNAAGFIHVLPPLRLRRRRCLDGGGRSRHPAKLYGRLPQRCARGARMWPPRRRHQCWRHPGDHERPVRTPRAASRSGCPCESTRIGPRQYLGRGGHLRTLEPKLEHRGVRTARDIRNACSQSSGGGAWSVNWRIRRQDARL